MNSREDLLRTARFNQHLHARLATRAWRWDMLSSLIVSLGGSASIMAVITTKGDAYATAMALFMAVAIAIRPVFRWGDEVGKRRASAQAWRQVEELCQDNATLEEIRRAERAAHRLDPINRPKDFEELRDWAYKLTNQELPAERLA